MTNVRGQSLAIEADNTVSFLSELLSGCNQWLFTWVGDRRLGRGAGSACWRRRVDDRVYFLEFWGVLTEANDQQVICDPGGRWMAAWMIDACLVQHVSMCTCYLSTRRNELI